MADEKERERAEELTSPVNAKINESRDNIIKEKIIDILEKEEIIERRDGLTIVNLDLLQGGNDFLDKMHINKFFYIKKSI